MAEEAVKDTFKDYLKEFFKGFIKKIGNLGKQEPLEVAFGQALKEFLALVQLGLEDAGVDEEDLEQYNDSLYKFVTDSSVLQALGGPFLIAIGNSGLNRQKAIPEVLTEAWNNLSLESLPEEFDWEKLVGRYTKKVNLILKKSEDLRRLLEENVTRGSEHHCHW
ncbi:MAG: hypothetical protein SAL70_14170 [Scytonema sp. PMC 1070.18]|nr:hypothetical protein [Scytonema sp. PMC 1070.18]